MIWMSSCAIATKGGKKSKIDYSLSEFNFQSLQSLTSSNSIAFGWDVIKGTKVKGYVIYRSSLNDKNMRKIAIIRDRYISSFVDTKLQPNSTYLYRFSTLGINGTESPHSETKAFNTKDALLAIAYIEGISNLPRKAQLIWRPHQNQIVNSYNIYKKSNAKGDKNKGFFKVANVPFNLSSAFMESNLRDNTTYKYYIKGLTYNGSETKASKIVSITTKKLPKNAFDVTASKKLPRKINITWESANKKASGFKVYASNKSNGKFKFLAYTPKKKFSHKLGNGVKVFYKISTIGKDGLESNIRASQTVMGSSLSIPKTPKFEEYLFDIQHKMISLRWNKSKRAAKFIIIKNNRKISNTKETSYLDKQEMVANNVHKYQIIAVDEFGIQSKPSLFVEVRVPQIK